MVCYNLNPRGVSFESCRTHFYALPPFHPRNHPGRGWTASPLNGATYGRRVDNTDGASNGLPLLNSQGQRSQIVFYWFTPNAAPLSESIALSWGDPFAYLADTWEDATCCSTVTNFSSSSLRLINTWYWTEVLLLPLHVHVNRLTKQFLRRNTHLSTLATHSAMWLQPQYAAHIKIQDALRTICGKQCEIAKGVGYADSNCYFSQETEFTKCCI